MPLTTDGKLAIMKRILGISQTEITHGTVGDAIVSGEEPGGSTDTNALHKDPKTKGSDGVIFDIKYKKTEANFGGDGIKSGGICNSAIDYYFAKTVSPSIKKTDSYVLRLQFYVRWI